MRQGKGGGCTGRQWEEEPRHRGTQGESEVRAISAPTSDFGFIFSSRRHNSTTTRSLIFFYFSSSEAGWLSCYTSLVI